MVILNYRSPYLRRILSTNNKKNNDENLTYIKLPNVSPEFFHIVLKYIYGGILTFEKYDTSDIIKILVAANELGLQELIPYLESYLIENKKNGLEENFDLIYRTSFENDSFSELQKYCTDLISKEPNKIFSSLNFSSIPEKILITIIQNNSLQMNYFLDNDSKKSIPRIIKEKEIYSKNIDSKIITFQHAELITKWIDRLEITDKLKTSYVFKSLYRDSRDGLSGSFRFDKFYEICKNQSQTLLVIKMKNCNEIIGGYNPIEWKFNDSYGVTKDSFIFAFGGKGTKHHIISRVINETKAIYGSFFTSFGPSFGDKDLYLKKNSYNNELKVICNKNDYEKHIRNTNNSCFVEEFEVFQVVPLSKFNKN
ncbi:BTB/POZ protein [Rhizophagus irregularis DAOM 181602=DAOM 197198]|nr:BTB/POZ protein [Rhizophagus irregularis DAOM 181602=DAOM 197198]